MNLEPRNPGKEHRKDSEFKIPSWFHGFQISSIFVDSLADDAEDIVLAHDQVRFAVDPDFGAAVF